MSCDGERVNSCLQEQRERGEGRQCLQTDKERQSLQTDKERQSTD